MVVPAQAEHRDRSLNLSVYNLTIPSWRGKVVGEPQNLNTYAPSFLGGTTPVSICWPGFVFSVPPLAQGRRIVQERSGAGNIGSLVGDGPAVAQAGEAMDRGRPVEGAQGGAFSGGKHPVVIGL